MTLNSYVRDKARVIAESSFQSRELSNYEWLEIGVLKNKKNKFLTNQIFIFHLHPLKSESHIMRK